MKTIFKLFGSVFLFSCLSLSASIIEVRLDIEKMDSPCCTQNVLKQLQAIKGVNKAAIYSKEGIGQITWKNDAPFSAAELHAAFAKTPFRLHRIDIDVEGVLEMQDGKRVLHSKPDQSLFYIDNYQNRAILTLKSLFFCKTTQDRSILKIKEGQTTRFKGIVKNRNGKNYLFVTEVLPEIALD
ncbi:MAG: hypothetical protein JWO53_532 [Chlamydiia bacterium]|nr:hypothetical protein [Chlamydiia bacterium]